MYHLLHPKAPRYIRGLDAHREVVPGRPRRSAEPRAARGERSRNLRLQDNDRHERRVRGEPRPQEEDAARQREADQETEEILEVMKGLKYHLTSLQLLATGL